MSPPRILTAAGPRAAEELVFERIERHREATREDLSLLARPLRIVVPSISLREHLGAALVRRFGAVAGCRVTTLASLAREILEQVGEASTAGPALFEVLVRRLSRHREALAKNLGDLEGGFGVVAGTVRDLLDAGLETGHAAALDEYLRSAAPRVATPAQLARARAVVETALALRLAFGELGLEHRSTLYAKAREALESRGPAFLPTHELLIHGFADATGVVTDLLESLLRVFGATLVLDRPPWPGDEGGKTAAGHAVEAHGERFVRRLAQVAPWPGELSGPPPAPAMLELLSAPDLDAEMREIALRVRRLLLAGTTPETIGVVARDLEPVGMTVRRHFRAFGIPFSALGAPGPQSGAGRDLAVLAELLERGGELTLERWLDVVDLDVGDLDLDLVEPGAGQRSGHERSGHERSGSSGKNRRGDLRLAFSVLGASRLDQLARLEIPAGAEDFPLPARDALESVEPFPGEPRGRAVRRRLDRGLLRDVTARGRHLAARMEDWRQAPAPSFAEHEKRLRDVVERQLGWAPERPARRLIEETLTELEVPGELDLERDEFLLVLLPALERRRNEPLGGRGGGVQLLSAMEARGRTFEHLFVCGLTRGAFPRVVREEPLLPDRLRRDLARLLPDLPIKAASFAEERFLFAQLTSAALHVSLSYHEEDANGRGTAPSPLLEGLAKLPTARAPQLWTPSPAACRPIDEELVVRALYAGRAGFAELLEPALVEARRAVLGEEGGGSAFAHALADSRLAVLAELDPDRSTADGRRRARRLGPYFGFIGRPHHPADPRRGDLWVTTLESLAACPWQTFLTRVLRVGPMPDPLAALPSLRGLLVGRVVHRVLERAAKAALGESPAPEGAAVPWPPAAQLEALLAAEAAAVLGDEGLGYAALERAAVEQARPYLEVAREVDWQRGAPRVLRVEATEVVGVEDESGRRRPLRFRADRVDAVGTAAGGAARRYTDYKTGAPGRRRRGESDELARKIAGGEWLQAAAYAARAMEGEEALGRYVFLRPDLDEADRILELASSNENLRRVFAASVRTLLRAWDNGTFFPRLVEPHEDVEPRRCRYCRVAEACLRRDSGSRVRLRRRAEKKAVGEGEALERAWRGVWDLRRPEAAPETEEVPDLDLEEDESR